VDSYLKRTEVITSEALAACQIEDGMTIAIGGLLSSSHPMAIIRQIIKNRTRNLTILAGSAGLELDLLIGAGCVKKVVLGLMTAESVIAVPPRFRKAAEGGDIDIWEAEEGIYAAGLQAAALGIPFMPTKIGLGTSLPDINPDLKFLKDPIGNEPLLAVPALKADVAILHAAWSDPYGNIQHVGTGFNDRALYRAAAQVLVEVEQIVPNETIKKNPMATSIPGADMVVRAPFGAHPFSSPGFYIEDRTHMQSYIKYASYDAKRVTEDRFEDYLREYVDEPVTHLDYLERIGIKRLLSLYEY
jgi:glutaconate CoA-transferase, subunit A